MENFPFCRDDSTTDVSKCSEKVALVNPAIVGANANVDAELEQFPMEARGAPLVLDGHAPAELAHLLGERIAPVIFGARTPAQYLPARLIRSPPTDT